MFTLAFLLSIFKYGGLVLASTSTIWGLTHETSIKDSENQRHLTKAGKYSIAFVIAGLLISLNTAAIESINKQRDNERAEEKEQREKQQKALERLGDLQRQEADKQEQRQKAEEARRLEDAWKQEQRDNLEEARRQRDLDIANQQQQTLEVLTQVSRSVQKINTIELSAWIDLPIDHPALRKFRDRLDGLLDENLRNTSLPPGNRVQILALTSFPEVTKFGEGEDLAHFLVTHCGDVRLAFYKRPIDPNKFGLAGRAPNENFPGYLPPDLTFDISEPERFARLDVIYELNWKVDWYNLPPVESLIHKPRRLRINPSEFRPDPKFIEGTGAIRSIPDLLGAQLFVFVSNGVVTGDPKMDSTVAEIRRHARVQTLRIKIDDRTFWIRNEQLRFFPSENNDLVAYSVFRFPDSERGLKLLESPYYGR